MDVSRPLKPLVLSDLKPPMNTTLITDREGLKKLKAFFERKAKEPIPAFGYDTETNVVHDYWNRVVRSMQFGDKTEQYVIDLLAFAGSKDKLIDSQKNFGKHNGDIYKEIWEVIEEPLCSNKFLKIGVNLGFEYAVTHWNFGKRIWHLYSIDMAERVLWAGAHSLKDYAFYSLEQIFGRYFGFKIDKSLQETFDLETPLTPNQVLYASFDTRAPISVYEAQQRVLTKDQLLTTAQIENDAIGSYIDMHLHGQNINKERWLARIQKTIERRQQEVRDLDAVFIPIVGRKDEAIDYEKLTKLEDKWKNGFETATKEELALASAKRQEKDPAKKATIATQLKELLDERKRKKAEARTKYSELSKARTAALKIIEKCEGDAFINYSSNPQMIEALNKLPEVRAKGKLEDIQDDTLLKYNDIPVVKVFRRYKKGKKDTGTYGDQWTRRWTTKPCKEEGWLHPGDGKLHCVYNQLEAETGRSSSSKPNGQNLPHEDEVRHCFVCDPPDERIRISKCCEADTEIAVDGVFRCKQCGRHCSLEETKAEEYCIVTCDMSGAELRIIADLANAQSWIEAFTKGQDVHSVGTEILYPEKWPLLVIKSALHPDKWSLEDCKKEKVPLFNPDGTPLMKAGDDGVLKHVHVPPCAYYAAMPDGTLAKRKCSCPEHKVLRDGNKATNFLLCYGGGPSALADALDVDLDAAKDLYKLHEFKFPDIWGYLKWSGEQAKEHREARDMFGRRRLLPEPTWESAKQWIRDEWPEKLELPEDQCEKNLFNFKAQFLREPDEEELWKLTHSAPDPNQIKWAMRALWGSIERRGKNHCIQGTNASIIKRAMGCGFDKDGKGYLWHLLPPYMAKIVSMVHDELLIHCPKRYAKVVAEIVANAFKRAAAEVMTRVIMEAEYNISDHWQK